MLAPLAGGQGEAPIFMNLLVRFTLLCAGGSWVLTCGSDVKGASRPSALCRIPQAPAPQPAPSSPQDGTQRGGP